MKTTMERWKSIAGKEANSATGINRGNIGECCLGHRKSAGGYFWRYL